MITLVLKIWLYAKSPIPFVASQGCMPCDCDFTGSSHMLTCFEEKHFRFKGRPYSIFFWKNIELIISLLHTWEAFDWRLVALIKHLFLKKGWTLISFLDNYSSLLTGSTLWLWLTGAVIRCLSLKFKAIKYYR